MHGEVGSCVPTTKRPKQVIISYSHNDLECLNKVLDHLTNPAREGMFDVWYDKRIETGRRWNVEIQEKFRNADAAVLIISARFFCSEYIVRYELPALLDGAEHEVTRIFPIIFGYSEFPRHRKLRYYQTVNPPDKPLKTMGDGDSEEFYDKLAKELEDHFSNDVIGKVQLPLH